MKPNPNIKEIELIVENENDFLSAMGLVEYPAIEKDFFYFNKQEKKLMFKEVEERIIVSPALIPEKRIFRTDGVNDWYVYFSKETIKKLSQNFLISDNFRNTTEQHENEVSDIHLIYSWLVENEQDQANTKWNFNVPVGTWMVMYKINNDDIWSKIKNGEINGVSIEAFLTEKYEKHTSTENIYKKMVDDIKDLLKNI